MEQPKPTIVVEEVPVPVPLPPKPFYESKTFWFNLLGGGLEIVQALTDLKIVPLAWATIGLAVGNILLRRITSQPITFTGKP